MIPAVLRVALKWLLRVVWVVLSPVCNLLACNLLACNLVACECPPPRDPVLLHSARQLARMVRERQVKSAHVVAAYIRRAQQVNPVLNAVVQDRFEDALKEANEADEFVESGTKTLQELADQYPLLGVPITVKESIALKGMSNQSGRVHRTSVAAERDAEAVKLVKSAGAIPILVSNTPELCMFWETFNNVTGKTRNPYNTSRTPGGSSGGEAALLASGASVLGLASDIGGSLRIPAMFTGIFGHKPTPWVVSTDGHVPDCVMPSWPDFFTLGPMVRYAEDLPLILSCIASEDKRSSLKLEKPVPIANIKFFYMENDNDSHLSDSIDPSMTKAMRQYVAHLEMTHGIVAEKVCIQEMKNAFEIATSILLDIDGVKTIYFDESDPQKVLSVWPNIFKFLTCRSDSILPVVLYGLLKKFSKLTKNRVKNYVERNKKLQNEFMDLLGEDGVLLFPTFPCAAPVHYMMYTKLLNTGYMTIFNTLGLPVTNCPTGFNSSGLPIGMQVVANPYNDRLTFAVAKDVEDFFGGWKPPNQR